MRLVFLTMDGIHDINSAGIYTDLMRKFRNEGHEVYILTPRERRSGDRTSLTRIAGVYVLGVRTLNLQKSSVIEKGLGQILVAFQFKHAIKRLLNSVSFDLILYSTPPITLTKAIHYLKGQNPNAKSYLLLKDIFPQNAVDIGMLSKTGLKGIIYRYFRNKEKKLYALSDYIGCMSPANVEYVLKHNPDVGGEKVELAPNSYEVSVPVVLSNAERRAIRDKYHIPTNRLVFIYGGNLGKPQGIPFLLKCLKANSTQSDFHFVIIGDGTEYRGLSDWYELEKPNNVSLFQRLPKDEYDQLVRACDVGLIFLEYRFTIPNYPSRLLSYLMEKKPIIAATDPVCDMGFIAEANSYGYYCHSNSVDSFNAAVNKIMHSDIKAMGENAYQFFLNNYTVDHTYNAIVRHM